MRKYDKRDLRETMIADVIEPLIVFEPNKDYVNEVIQNQVQMEPVNMEFTNWEDLPASWPSFRFRDIVNADGVPSEMITQKAEQMGQIPKAA